MRCSKCGKWLPLLTKFCQKCGTAVSTGQRKKNLIALGIWVLIFLLLVPIIYFLLGKYDPAAPKHSQLYIFLTAALVSLLATSGLVIIYFIISSLVRFIIRRPILGSITIGAILILVGFGVYFYLSGINNNELTDSIVLIQENLNEVAVAKIMGDSIIAKKPIPGASMVRVKSIAELVANRLEFMLVQKELLDYQRSVIVWSQAITTAADDTKIWSNVGDQPRDFQLKLSQKQSEVLFQDSIKKIIELKEFGDNAIKRKDRGTMLYIAAKLVTQEHWLNGVLHSKSAGFLSLSKLATPALALSFGEGVPDIGPGVDVTCQVCSDPKIKWTTQLRAQYGCDTKCKPTQNNPQTPPQTNQKNQEQTNPNQQNQGQTNQNNKQSGQNIPGNNMGDQEASVSGNSNEPLPFSYGNTAPRKICIGTGGLSVGDHTTNVFCVEDAIQSTNEIEASTIGFAEGKKGAEDDWDNNWHKEGGLGVISQTPTTNSSGHSPAVQAFYDGCQNKGGLVGGAGTVKGGLPTTESGYTCEYKINDKNGANIPCWDFLTYSGGRYMGGNNGCQEKNLLPKIDDQTLKDKTAGLGGKWDGDYALSGTTIKCAGDFAYSIPVPATVAPVRNNVMSSTQGPIPISGNSIVWTMSISTQQENATVNISEIDTFRFYQSGNTTGVGATYSANITVSTDDEVKISTCYGSIGGARQ